MKILGLIIGKAIFERISINCYLDRTILRQITGSPVFLEDVYTYDEHVLIAIYKDIQKRTFNDGNKGCFLDSSKLLYLSLITSNKITATNITYPKRTINNSK